MSFSVSPCRFAFSASLSTVHINFPQQYHFFPGFMYHHMVVAWFPRRAQPRNTQCYSHLSTWPVSYHMGRFINPRTIAPSVWVQRDRMVVSRPHRRVPPKVLPRSFCLPRRTISDYFIISFLNTLSICVETISKQNPWNVSCRITPPLGPHGNTVTLSSEVFHMSHSCAWFS